MAVNSAHKSASLEGHYLAYQSARALNKRGDGQRLVQSLRDGLGLNKLKGKTLEVIQVLQQNVQSCK